MAKKSKQPAKSTRRSAKEFALNAIKIPSGPPCICCQSPIKEDIITVLTLVAEGRSQASANSLRQWLLETYPELKLSLSSFMRHIHIHEPVLWAQYQKAKQNG